MDAISNLHENNLDDMSFNENTGGDPEGILGKS
jgi:hypothetical protein